MSIKKIAVEAAIKASTPPASHDAVALTEDELADCWIRALKAEPNHATRLQVQYARNIEAMLAARYATLTAEVSRLTGELEAASARLHEVATLCATVEQERDRLTAELAEAREQLWEYKQRLVVEEAHHEQTQEMCDSLRDECERLREAAMATAAMYGRDCREAMESALSASGREGG